MLLRVAWRNVWRNPRRTGLTLAANVFAIVISLWTVALQAGTYARWVDTLVRLYPGHVEVSAEGYREERSLDYGMTLAAGVPERLDALAEGSGWAGRLESWALAIPDYEGSQGRAAMLVGVDPRREDGLSRIGTMVAEGRFLAASSTSERLGDPANSFREVVLGSTLARNLGADVGDPVVLLSMDYYGSQAAERFRLVGTLEVGDPTYDAYAAMVGLGDLQELLEFPGGLTHVAVFANAGQGEDVSGIATELAAVFPSDEYEVLAWQELIPDLVQMIELDRIGGWLTLGIVILVVAFGILNTILMSVLERTRELGVMRALGMRPGSVFRLVLLESAVLGVLGIAIGLALAVPGLWALEASPISIAGEDMAAVYELFRIEPVLVISLRASHLVTVPLAMFLVSLLAALPPALRASRGRPVDALREF